jgi:hypothetical protein
MAQPGFWGNAREKRNKAPFPVGQIHGKGTSCHPFGRPSWATAGTPLALMGNRCSWRSGPGRIFTEPLTICHWPSLPRSELRDRPKVARQNTGRTNAGFVPPCCCPGDRPIMAGNVAMSPGQDAGKLRFIALPALAPHSQRRVWRRQCGTLAHSLNVSELVNIPGHSRNEAVRLAMVSHGRRGTNFTHRHAHLLGIPRRPIRPPPAQTGCRTSQPDKVYTVTAPQS